MVARCSLALAVLALLTPGPAVAGTPASRQDPATVQWIEATLEEIASRSVNPPRAARALALVSVAMSDAAAAGTPAEKAAIAGAAATVLAHLFPDGATRFDRQAERAAGLGGGGFALGRRIGRSVVARARDDGSDAVWIGIVPVGPGLWAPTPPGFLPRPLEPLAGTWRTWNLAAPSQFRPPPPPSPGSDRLRAELLEVYEVSRRLTFEQKSIALFWADGAGTVTPPGHWNLIAIDLVRSFALSTLASARMFAALNTGQADAFVACWDAKFTYWTERPVTAIRRDLDPTWLPFVTTPPFPSYVSGHATTSGAASTVLAHFFPAAASQLRVWADEAALSRLYGGIHFRVDNDVGLELGRRVGELAIARAQASYQFTH